MLGFVSLVLLGTEQLYYMFILMCLCVCVRVCLSVCMSVCACLCKFVSVYALVCTYSCKCVFVCETLCMRSCAHVHLLCTCPCMLQNLGMESSEPSLVAHVEQLTKQQWSADHMYPKAGPNGLTLLHLASALGYAKLISALIRWR